MRELTIVSKYTSPVKYFNTTGVFFAVLVIIDTNEQKLATSIHKGSRIVLFVNLLYGCFRTSIPFQFNEENRIRAVWPRQKHKVSKAFARWEFPHNRVVFPCGKKCQRDGTGKSIFIIIPQNTCFKMGFFDTLCHSITISLKNGGQKPCRIVDCPDHNGPAVFVNGVDKLACNFLVRDTDRRRCAIIGEIPQMDKLGQDIIP